MGQPAPRARETADRSWMAWTLVGLAAIWVAVVAISLASPDLVSGSEQEHLPLAMFISWIWGLVASIGYLWGASKLRGDVSRRPTWIGLAIAMIVIWGAATILSVTQPTWETGSDPTQLPVWAIAVPIGAALGTVLASVVAGIFSQSPE